MLLSFHKKMLALKYFSSNDHIITYPYCDLPRSDQQLQILVQILRSMLLLVLFVSSFHPTLFQLSESLRQQNHDIDLICTLEKREFCPLGCLYYVLLCNIWKNAVIILYFVLNSIFFNSRHFANKCIIYCILTTGASPIERENH